MIKEKVNFPVSLYFLWRLILLRYTFPSLLISFQFFEIKNVLEPIYEKAILDAKCVQKKIIYFEIFTITSKRAYFSMIKAIPSEQIPHPWLSQSCYITFILTSPSSIVLATRYVTV